MVHSLHPLRFLALLAVELFFTRSGFNFDISFKCCILFKRLLKNSPSLTFKENFSRAGNYLT